MERKRERVMRDMERKTERSKEGVIENDQVYGQGKPDRQRESACVCV